MSCAADSYKKEDYHSGRLPHVLFDRFIRERRLPSYAVCSLSSAADSYKKEDYKARPFAPCPVGPTHTRKKTTKLGRLPHVLCGRFIQETRLPSLAVCPMSCGADSNSKEDYQATPFAPCPVRPIHTRSKLDRFPPCP